MFIIFSTIKLWVIFVWMWGVSCQVIQKLKLQKHDKITIDQHGAIIRGDLSKQKIALVFTGDEFADGGEVIRNSLKKQDVKAAFFLTGDFYQNPKFYALIQDLKSDGHYLGAHSDKHLLYADWENRDSLLVTKEEFERDLENNYKKMKDFGISRGDAPYFLPPYEWYNSEIARWTNEGGLQLINFSPVTWSTSDYTYPEMGERYRSSEEIYQSIIDYERKDPNGLNGFILLIHIGTDPRRTDKFYLRLEELLTELKKMGYRFAELKELLG